MLDGEAQAGGVVGAHDAHRFADRTGRRTLTTGSRVGELARAGGADWVLPSRTIPSHRSASSVSTAAASSTGRA